MYNVESSVFSVQSLMRQRSVERMRRGKLALDSSKWGQESIQSVHLYTCTQASEDRRPPSHRPRPLVPSSCASSSSKSFRQLFLSPARPWHFDKVDVQCVPHVIGGTNNPVTRVASSCTRALRCIYSLLTTLYSLLISLSNRCESTVFTVTLLAVSIVLNSSAKIFRKWCPRRVEEWHLRQ